MEERREDRVESFVKSASSQSNITLVLDEISVTPKKMLLQPGVEVADVSAAGGHVENHDAQQEQDRGTAQHCEDWQRCLGNSCFAHCDSRPAV